MVFRWLFGSSGTRDSRTSDRERPQQPSAAAQESSELDGDYEAGMDAPYGSGDNINNNSTGDDLTRPLKVPLTAMPLYLVDEQPQLKLSEYDMSRGQFARNVLALTHNAVRLEMADMWGDILPSLQFRCEQGAGQTLARDDYDDLRDWWSGFARFALTASLVEDMVVRKAFGDIYVGFDRELKAMEKIYHKVLEKNNVYLELAVRKMAKAVDEFEKGEAAASFTQLGKSWQALASVLADIYASSEQLVESVDRWVRNPFEYKDLERQATKIFTSKKRWGEDDAKRGEMVIILCRWVGTEDLMREWMHRNLTKRELRSIDKWMDDYRDRRLAIVDRFHQKKA